MRIQEALRMAKLASLENELLLAKAVRHDRAWVMAHPEHEVPEEASEYFLRWVRRREAHEPIAYILGEREFYGRTFAVDRRVLIPRPSTEGLIDLALDFLRTGKEQVRTVDTGSVAVAFALGDPTQAKWIADIGVGSGCIAVTLACERSDLKVTATDIRAEILDVARANAKLHGVADRIEFRRGIGIAPVNDLRVPFVIVSNPPYLVAGEQVMPDVVLYEPRDALFAGPKGLDVLLPLMRAATSHPFCRGVIVECKEEQVSAISEILAA